MYYRTCPYCGANLDPGEVCDCLTEKGRRIRHIRELVEPEKSGQMRLILETKEERHIEKAV